MTRAFSLAIVISSVFYLTQGEEISVNPPEILKTCRSGNPKSCSEIKGGASGVQDCVIYPFGKNGDAVNAQCDFETDGGSWTVIQTRSSGPREDFDREFIEYENGFYGNSNSDSNSSSTLGNYWIGLKVINALTSVNKVQELRIELEDWDGEKKYANYDVFAVAGESDGYRLTISGYSGDAGDSIKSGSASDLNNMKFTTKDQDNDMGQGNCASGRDRGGWWYNNCHWSDLNGGYLTPGQFVDMGAGIYWQTFRGNQYSLKSTQLKIRNSK